MAQQENLWVGHQAPTQRITAPALGHGAALRPPAVAPAARELDRLYIVLAIAVIASRADRGIRAGGWQRHV
jgi:hypothetical protein